MSDSEALDLLEAAIWASLAASAPIITVVMIVGLAVSLVQALTQVQEMTLTFVPKIVAALAVLAITAPFVGGVIGQFAERTYRMIERPVADRQDRSSAKR
jgi:flagellar biosynthesis protein FliQ